MTITDNVMNQEVKVNEKTKAVVNWLKRLVSPPSLEVGSVWINKSEKNNPWREYAFRVEEVRDGYVRYTQGNYGSPIIWYSSYSSTRVSTFTSCKVQIV